LSIEWNRSCSWEIHSSQLFTFVTFKQASEDLSPSLYRQVCLNFTCEMSQTTIERPAMRLMQKIFHETNNTINTKSDVHTYVYILVNISFKKLIFFLHCYVNLAIEVLLLLTSRTIKKIELYWMIFTYIYWRTFIYKHPLTLQVTGYVSRSQIVDGLHWEEERAKRALVISHLLLSVCLSIRHLIFTHSTWLLHIVCNHKYCKLHLNFGALIVL
jgi:hypothetical protein